MSVPELGQLKDVVKQALSQGKLAACILSKVRSKQNPYQKVSVRPLILRGKLNYQFAYHYPTKELHENVEPGETWEKIFSLLESEFRQGMFYTVEADWQVLISKKGAARVLQHAPSRKMPELEHDRRKNYLLQEGTPYPFLVELGVMNKEGRVLAKHYHKFRQLNRYLEVVADCLPNLKQGEEEGPLQIVDFGSGKAYLTFALYHFLVQVEKFDVNIIGLDLKKDVVSFCNRVASRLGYEKLKFQQGDIKDFAAEGAGDLVVSLHACDTATDFALDRAVKWGAKVILAVPCCQHELFGQLEQAQQKPLLEHGILKERAAALLTDAARAKLLEMVGYQVSVMEFIDMEHTPKNLLIRAFRTTGQPQKQLEREYHSFREYWGISPTLERLLRQG